MPVIYLESENKQTSQQYTIAGNIGVCIENGTAKVTIVPSQGDNNWVKGKLEETKLLVTMIKLGKSDKGREILLQKERKWVSEVTFNQAYKVIVMIAESIK